MSDPNRGVYGKFRVGRSDGKDAPGEKHDGCRYFVLDLDHDAFAYPALRAYADACRAQYPQLAADLTRVVDSRVPSGELRGGTMMASLMAECEPPNAD